MLQHRGSLRGETKNAPLSPTSSEEERVSSREDDDEYCDIPSRRVQVEGKTNATRTTAFPVRQVELQPK